MNKTENKKKEDILKKAKKIVSIEGWSSEIFSKLQKQNIEKNDLFYFFPDGYKDLLEYALQKNFIKKPLTIFCYPQITKYQKRVYIIQ